jgi:hypothetical protein
MDPHWKIKKNEWDEECVSALAFFDAIRVRFACEDLLQRFPILLEYYVHAEIRQRLAASDLRSQRGEFHVRAMCNYLEESTEGIFVIERHMPPDMADDRAILLRTFDALWASG